MASLYTNVSGDVHDYVMRLSAESGMSVAAVVQTLLDEARRRGWSVSPRAGEVVESS